MDLKTLVKERVRFAYAQDGALWYTTTESAFTFPVPFSEVETARFPAEDKGAYFMRWIRKYLTAVTEAKNASQQD